MRKTLIVIALSVMALVAVLGGMFVIGETLADPGGWRAVGLVALWLVPLVALSLLAWWRPELSTWLLLGLVAVAAGFVVWSTLQPVPWHDFQDQHGPVLAIGLFALSVPVAVLGWHRPLVGGGLLVGIGLLPLVSVVLLGVTGQFERGVMPPQAGLSMLASPLLLVGALLLIAGALPDTGHTSSARGGHGPHQTPPRLA